jgi:hypothetical protein
MRCSGFLHSRSKPWRLRSGATKRGIYYKKSRIEDCPEYLGICLGRVIASATRSFDMVWKYSQAVVGIIEFRNI